MKRKNIFALSVMAIVIITALNLLTVGESTGDYKTRIERARKERNRFMISSDSPLTEEAKKSFEGLRYYPIDKRFKVIAKLSKIKKKQPVFISSNTGEPLKYIPFAYAIFKLESKEQRVILYQDWEEQAPNRLSLMFTDQTSARETYGGGRYLDVFYRNTNSVIIDFNTAYNPYCHFNSSFSCPLPPAENRLAVAIKAGEKLYTLVNAN